MDDELDNISAPVPTKVAYDANAIKTLSSLEHIRHRPGMYIGKLGDGTYENDGVYVLVKEVIDNSVDEFIMGCGRRIDVTLRDNCVKIRDYGRGIPLEKLVDCVSQINTGAKYNSDVFQFSVGLNGVGTKAVNALSERFIATAFREGNSNAPNSNTANSSGKRAATPPNATEPSSNSSPTPRSSRSIISIPNSSENVSGCTLTSTAASPSISTEPSGSIPKTALKISSPTAWKKKNSRRHSLQGQDA